MKKIMAMALALSLFSPIASFAKSDNSCDAYVKNTKVDGNMYRFNIIDETGTNINSSNDWSFSAANRDVAQVLNLAHLLRVKICINYIYGTSSWTITNVSI